MRSNLMKTPTPEVAYMMALVAAQKARVVMATYELSMKTEEFTRLLGNENYHLKCLEDRLKVVRRDNSKAKDAAAMPWLKRGRS
jgi:hypothetical protein